MINIEKQLGEKIAKAGGLTVAKLGLRFDRVVVRLLGNLRTSLEHANLKQEAVLLTITAPIWLPAKTEIALKEQIGNLLDSGVRNRKITIFQNEARLSIVKTSVKQTAKFIGLVHNPGTDPKLLLDLAAQWLNED